ncbi:MAG TPA: NADP-specific glutamate dehydrogenase [Saprospiraceae bacterium]|nr:NADP-specific glutamate dehydrogenase [Saprospiraceae bacterium]
MAIPDKYKAHLSTFMEDVTQGQMQEKEFLQAVYEVAESVIPYIEENKKYKENKILRRLVEPERVIIFRVPWVDDQNVIQINRGYRVQYNSAIGPYKGGTRFHPSVNLSILKFLGFEQTFKNALTTLPMGGGKGGANFNPRGKSEGEIMRFCQSYMTELSRHIGQFLDIPGGDIGVGIREIGYLFGQYKRLQNEYSGMITGKGLPSGGSHIRMEATGYGLIYFTAEMMKSRNDALEGKKILISGSGNVAQFACEKAIEFGGKVITLSDSSGFILDEEGINKEKLDFVKELKNVKRGRIKDYISHFQNAVYYENKKPWKVSADVALPCATENELDENDAKLLVQNGCIIVAEGANMPSTHGAIEFFQSTGILYAPGKASNAGGVSTSGLEMSQNSIRENWTRQEVDERLQVIMKKIHDQCEQYGSERGSINYLKGANLAGFIKVADAMVEQGIV